VKEVDAVVKDTLDKLMNIAVYVDDDEVTDILFDIAQVIKQLYREGEV
jgi:hypothetical protein